MADPGDSILSALGAPYKILPNTSGARDADEAIRLARLARAAGGYDWIKLEVTPEPSHLLPDPVETLKAAEALARFRRDTGKARGGGKRLDVRTVG